ncbi:MAG: efflux RND transporter permease subunit [Alphaproteobacteria bacterium]|nr:efflux RND transporter permease subunit [Alphaproteobacteria bacterium]
MLKFFVRRPVTTIMFVLFWVVLGIYSYPKMNVEMTPPLDLPMVTTTFVYPGAAPSEVESQVIKKAENAIAQISGVKKITSQVFENGGYIATEFNLGEDVNTKATEVKNKIDAISSEFPTDLKTPVVDKLNVLQQSVSDIAIYGAEPRKVVEYVDDVLSTKISGIPGVARVSVFGGEKRAVRIQMLPDEMSARGVAITDIVSALGNKNLNVPGGKIESGDNSANVRLIGEFDNISEIENFRITTAEGLDFKLSDVATVTDGARDIETGARYNGKDVVIASVEKASDGNAVKIAQALKKRLPEYQAALQEKFPDAQMEIITDSSITVLEEVNGTINGVALGILFTVLILLAFTRNLRSTIIAGVVIPASLIAGLFFVNYSGFSINMITLLAYSSALGTLVSNAIILIEAALQEMQSGKSAEDAAIDGTKRVAVSVLAGVGTNVVVFLPLAFMGGIVGQFMNQFGMTVVYLTLLSLVFSFSLTPMMIAKILRAKKKDKSVKAKVVKQNDNSRLRKWYDYQIAHPGRVLLMALGVLIGSALLMNFVGSEFQPTTDANEINITARAPMGATYEKSESIAQQIEQATSQFPEVQSTIVKIGNRGMQNISVTLKLIHHETRNVSDKELVQKILPTLAKIPDAEIQMRTGQTSSNAVSADLVLYVYGEDDAKRNAYADKLIHAINGIEEVQSAVLAQQNPNDEIRFVPDQEKMGAWGIQNSYAGMVLRAALYGNDTYKYKENGKEYPIVLEFAKPFKVSSMFDSIFVKSPKGMVALSELGDIQKVPATSNITRLNKERITEIDINIGKSTMGPVQKKIEAEINKLDWEIGYKTGFGGMSEIQDETTTEIAMAFLLATVLTFMLLAAILNSFTHPLTIATSIITSFAGVFILMFLSGATTNVGAMLSYVMLVGLVVNNNILVLEPTVNRVRSGQDAKTALWTELNDKKDMVLMTSIAIMAGMLPQLWAVNGMKVAMSAVLIGGMGASLVFTFVLTPALFFLMENMRSKLKKNKK